MSEEEKVTDHYGNEITTSSRVAYNYSGEVRLGFVTSVKTTKNRYGYSKHLIKVQELGTLHLSKVTNRRNLVVLN